MPRFEIVRVFTVERTFEVDAPTEAYALAHPDLWEESGEITQDVISTDINEFSEPGIHPDPDHPIWHR